MADQTIHQVLRETCRKFGSRNALGYRKDKEYRYITYAELWERVRRFRAALHSLGLRKGDRLAILSENRPEWAIADLAAQCMGVISVPIYATLPMAQVRHIVSDSAARILIVSDKKQLAKAQEIRDGIRTLEHIVSMDTPESESVLRFEDLANKELDSSVDIELEVIAAAVSPDDTATYIYTSGTTGDPKGAMLSHRNLLHTGFAARQIVTLSEQDVFLSFAPLSHIIERTGGHYLPLSIGALIVYSEGLFTIAGEFPAVKPTLFLCVPRLYESMQEKILEAAAKQPENKRKMFEWAMSVGGEVVKRREENRGIGPILALKRFIADRMVHRKIREKVLGDRMRFLVAGGAPLNPETTTFFQSLGVEMLEGYGLTELPVIALNRPGRARRGTVGELLPGLEVKIAPDGEILSRGPSLMKGYFGNPEATAAAIDGEGWFHTGDVGEMNGGYLRITDRKKDIIVLANGKNVAPQPIEAKLKQSSFISEAVLLGDNASGIVAIVVPAFDRLKTWAQQQELDSADVSALVARAETRKLFKEEIDRNSIDLADFEKIKRFTLADRPFSIETGELTPTLKVKRKVIAEKHADQIAQMVR